MLQCLVFFPLFVFYKTQAFRKVGSTCVKIWLGLIIVSYMFYIMCAIINFLDHKNYGDWVQIQVLLFHQCSTSKILEYQCLFNVKARGFCFFGESFEFICRELHPVVSAREEAVWSFSCSSDPWRLDCARDIPFAIFC